MVLKLKALDGMDSDEAGKITGMHTTSINRIISRYKQEGMQAITGTRHLHGKRYMSQEEEVYYILYKHKGRNV